MEYFGICAQPGLGSSVWGNQSWPSRMAIATTKYSPSIKEWNLQFREEAVYDSIVSNVAHLSSDQAQQILSEAKVKASETEEPANKQAFYEIDGIDKLICQEG